MTLCYTTIVQDYNSDVAYVSISKLNQPMFGNYQLVNTTRCQVRQIFSYAIIIYLLCPIYMYLW